MNKSLLLTLLTLLSGLSLTQIPTQYTQLGGTHTLQANIIQAGYSPDQQLFVALASNDSNVYAYNGLTYAFINKFETVVDDRATAFSFSNTFTNYLIVGTSGGNLCVFPINNDFLSGCIVTQNGDNDAITSIAVSSNGLIAVGGASDNIYFFTLNADNKLISAGQTTTAFLGSTKSLVFTPDGSTLLVGEKAPGNFISISTTNFAITPIDALPTNGVAACGIYYARLVAEGIQIKNLADNSTVQTITFPNVQTISISTNAQYITASDGASVKAWSSLTPNANPPAYAAFSVPVNNTASIFAASLYGSNIMIQTAAAAGSFSEWSFCPSKQFYILADNTCVGCDA